MIEIPQIVQTVERDAAVIHITVPRSEIQKVMGPGISEVMSVIAAQGIAPAGPWFSHHLKMAPGIFDFEVGVPIASRVVAAGRVVQGTLPQATVARTIYQGPYDKLGAAWGEFEGWVRLHGYTTAGDFWEQYLVGPESGADAANYRTELNRPLINFS